MPQFRLVGALAVLVAGSAAAADPPIDFNRQIRPILSDKCFACHGPDEAKRKGELRLDTRDGALAKGESGKPGIVPGKPDQSELIRRITTADAGDRMPPAKSNKSLSAEEQQLLARWIAQGASWSEHWLWSPLARPAVPATTAKDPWVRNAVDAFVLAKLKAEGQKPAPEADRVTLIRRLSFDLTGLPPTPAEVDAFLADGTDQAYEKLVDRLIASPRYGERIAVHWLDLVRYADSIGYHSDNPMPVSPYRDYVIRAFNEDLPFDRFTREQLAGDLLPDANLRTRVGSAFNMLVKSTEEGGAQAKDYEAKMSADRVRAVGTVWLGATLGCAECHTHKYDPYTITDFYSLAAFFADIQEKPIGRRGGAITVPSEDAAATTQRLESELGKARADRDAQADRLKAQRAAWEEKTRQALLDAAKAPVDPKVKVDPKKPNPKDLGLPKPVADALRAEPASRDQAQREAIESHWEATAPELADINKQIAAKQKELEAAAKGGAQCLVSSSGNPRVVRVLPRGNWQDESGQVVQPATPHFLPGMEGVASGKRATRLDLANWLLAERNTIVPRVAANRLWRLFFGHGLSRRMEDLGAQGEPPTHPELLDWLAVEYREKGWKTKSFVKLLVMSNAYRQDSRPGADLATRDPDNRLYARQSRTPLDAEVVRDSALYTGGLLVEKVGGASVFPYQPDGYWAQLNFPTRKWPTSTGEGLYRRTLYTHWQRSYVHPMLIAFDASTREECIAARTRSNIPQQALVLLNDPQFVEAARGFAARLLKSPAKDDQARAVEAFRIALSRPPSAEESKILLALVAKHRSQYAQDKAAAEALLKVGAAPAPADLDQAELAAWTSAARTLLNLHTAISRY